MESLKEYVYIAKWFWTDGYHDNKTGIISTHKTYEGAVAACAVYEKALDGEETNWREEYWTEIEVQELLP